MDNTSPLAPAAAPMQAAEPQSASNQGAAGAIPAPRPRGRLPPTAAQRAAALVESYRPPSASGTPPGGSQDLRHDSISSTASSPLRPLSGYEAPSSPSLMPRPFSASRPALPNIRPLKRAEPPAAPADVPPTAPSQTSQERPQLVPEQGRGQGQGQQAAGQRPSTPSTSGGPDQGRGQGQGQQVAGQRLNTPPSSAAASAASSPPPPPSPLSARSPYQHAAATPQSSLREPSASASASASAASTPRHSNLAPPSPTPLASYAPAASSFQALAPPTSLPSFSSSRSRSRSLPRSGGSLAAFSTGSGHHPHSPSLLFHSPPSFSAPDSLTLTIHVITFNMGNITPSRLPPEMFGAHRGDADVFVVGTQESCPAADLDRLLAEQLPESQYTRVAYRSLMAISIHVFVRRDVEHLAACVTAVAVPTGIGNVLGNKGGVAVGLRLAGAHVLLVNSHLAAHDGFVERRNADFRRICAGLPLPPQRVLATAAPEAPPRPPSASGSSGPGSGSGTFLTVVSTPQAAQAQPELQSYPARILTPRASPAPLPARYSPSPVPRPSSALAAADEPPLLRPGGPPRLPHNYHPSAGPGAGRGRRPSGSEYAPHVNRVASSADIGGRPDGGGGGRSESALDHYDVVLWAGDLNYRIQGIVQGIKHALEKGMYEVLAANDQLGAEQRGGRAFQGFHEQPLNFVPTFKFVHNSDDYNLKRIPSWTDRVLFLCNSPAAYCALRPLYYTCIHEMKESDHRPVVAGFEVVLNPTKKHMRHHVEL